MAEQKDFHSLDELFRKSFENLPDSPDASGWDTPSDRVWQHVQTQIKPPHQGWSSSQILLVASGAIAIAVGLYLAFARPVQPATNQQGAPEQANQPPAAELPVTATPAETEKPYVLPARPHPVEKVKPASKDVSPASTPAAPADERPVVETPLQGTPPQPVVKPENSTGKMVNSSGRRAERTGALPLPGSDPSEPNSTVLRHKRRLWTNPLPGLRTTRKPDTAPALPPSDSPVDTSKGNQ